MANKTDFPYNFRDITEKIEDYKAKVRDGTFKRSDFWHFCGYIGVDARAVVDVVKSPSKSQIDVSRALKKYITWQQGEYMTASAWTGPAGSKAIFALKQDLGGMVLSDRQDVNASGAVTVSVKFGGETKDPFG